MTRVLNKIVAASFMAAVISGAAFAGSNSMPSSKSTAMVSKINVLSTQVAASGGEPWSTILSSAIKTSNPADLFVDVSLECGLYTNTVVKSKGGTKDTSTASASVKVRVLVDGKPTMPDEVTFCRRTQELTATFQGLLTDCLDVNGTLSTINEDCLQPEEVGLILDTMNANAFNFIAPDVGVGVHTIDVQAMVDDNNASQQGYAEAYATIGKGSAVVDETNMIKDLNVTQ